MSLVRRHSNSFISNQHRPPRSMSIVRAVALVLFGASGYAHAEVVSKSADIPASPQRVWALIGPFCAIQDWLPPVGTCTQDGKSPPTRTLVTKDGKATFVELQTGR